jgi:cell division protein FtsA
MEAQTIVARVDPVRRIARCFANLGLEIDGFILEPLALAGVLLSPVEAECGAVLIDAGGETTGFSLFRQDRLCFAGTLPVGGFNIANDLAIGLNVPLAAAEALIRTQPIPPPQVAGRRSTIQLPGPEWDHIEVSASDAADIVDARVADLFALCAEQFEKSGQKPGEKASTVVFAGKGLRGIGAAEPRALGIFGLPSRFAECPSEPPCDWDTTLAFAMADFVVRRYRRDPFDSKVAGPAFERDGEGSGKRGVFRKRHFRRS